MTADEDEDALSWAGDHDPSHVDTPVAPKVATREKASKRGAGARGTETNGTAGTHDADGTDAEHAEHADPTVLPVVASSAFLISLGILGGIYLLYTIGWIISLQRFLYLATNPLDEGAFATQQYLAIAAPVVWFASVIWFTRRHRPVSRLVWLLAGALLLVPWSFVMGS